MTPESTFRIAFWILLVGVIVMRIYFALQVRRAGERVMPDSKAIEREGLGMFAVRAALFFLLLGWLILYGINPPWMKVLLAPFPGWLRWAGFALGLASLGFWTWTQVMLGKEWSPQLQLREEHHLVTAGPYARIRHPIYTATISYGASLALVTANWVFIVFAVVAGAGLFSRIPKEEQMMIEQFGEEYRAYMQRTGRLLPKL
jgi:protein-S-isoprenylcysteine O-methyltransferase Ste14